MKHNNPLWPDPQTDGNAHFRDHRTAPHLRLLYLKTWSLEACQHANETWQIVGHRSLYPYEVEQNRAHAVSIQRQIDAILSDL